MLNIKCSFCGLGKGDVEHIIEGINAYICGECVVQSLSVVQDAKNVENRAAIKGVKTPKMILEELNKYVVGQDKAKKILSVAVYNHYKRISGKLSASVKKNNIFLVGPTGSGKTYALQVLAKYLDIPFSVSDATSLTENGYVGDDVDSIIGKLVVAAGGDVKKAERGICMIDEFDKLAVKHSNGRDIGGEGVQQSVLKMLEGGLVEVNPNGGKKRPEGPVEIVDTSNILFILGGAFVGVKENKHKRELGLHAKDPVEEEYVIKTSDLVKFGMIPELVGRVPVIAEMDKLSIEQLYQILIEPKDSLIGEYKALLEADGKELLFSNSYLKEVASKAYSLNTGARALRSILEERMLDIMFEAPESETLTIKVE